MTEIFISGIDKHLYSREFVRSVKTFCGMTEIFISGIDKHLYSREFVVSAILYIIFRMVESVPGSISLNRTPLAD